MAITAGQAAQAITNSKGFITQAAKMLGCSRTHLYNLIKKHATVKEALTDAREEMKDFAESKLFAGIKDGNPTLIIFFAKTQMKDRGYTERVDVNQTSVNIDYASLSDEQLERLANGANPLDVIASNTG